MFSSLLQPFEVSISTAIELVLIHSPQFSQSILVPLISRLCFAVVLRSEVILQISSCTTLVLPERI